MNNFRQFALSRCVMTQEIKQHSCVQGTQGGEKVLSTHSPRSRHVRPGPFFFRSIHAAAPAIVYEERRSCFCRGVIARWNPAPIFGRRSALERKISRIFLRISAPDEGFCLICQILIIYLQKNCPCALESIRRIYTGINAQSLVQTDFSSML